MSYMGQKDQNGRIGFHSFSTLILQRRFLKLHSQKYVDINKSRREKRLKTLLDYKAMCCDNNECSSMLCLQAVMSSACITNAFVCNCTI